MQRNAKRNRYEVIVGNVGTVYTGTSEKEANQEFDAYVLISKSGVGRAGKEEVTLFKDGEIHKEYQPQGDFRVINHGSIVMLYPISDEAKEWVADHLPDETLTLGPGYAIEPRYAGPIVEGIQGDGLTVQ